MDEWRRESSSRGGDHLIAMKQQRSANPDRNAVDTGYDRLSIMGQRGQEFDRLGGARRIVMGGPVFQKIFQIVARREHARFARNDQAADRRVVLSGVDRPG